MLKGRRNLSVIVDLVVFVRSVEQRQAAVAQRLDDVAQKALQRAPRDGVFIATIFEREGGPSGIGECAGLAGSSTGATVEKPQIPPNIMVNARLILTFWRCPRSCRSSSQALAHPVRREQIAGSVCGRAREGLSPQPN